MKGRLGKYLGALYRPVRRMTVPEWARENVDFSRVPSYETPLRGPYDPDFMPYWKEPAEAATDPAVREIWALKPSRAGASENLLLNPLRYTVACDPKSTLYISGDQTLTEDFMETRIKLGLRCARGCAGKLALARSAEHRIYFEDMDLIVRWPRAKGAFKQRGYALILADEVSTWPTFGPDMLRQRAETYGFAHIIGVSSMDPAQRRPSKEDPIFQLFLEGDQRYWMMPDPKTRRLFRWEMGTDKTVHGLKWDPKARREDKTWDYDRLRASAYYVTPDGTRIENDKRLALVAKGHWRATNARAPAGRRSYHLNAFCLPWKKGDFGDVAVEFLKAKRAGPEQLRVFVYEFLAEEWKENVIPTSGDQVSKRAGGYAKGTYLSESEAHKTVYIGKEKNIFLTVDVQQSHVWYAAREWIKPGDSGLVDCGHAITWAQVDELAKRLKAYRIGVDCNYEARRGEVETFCSDNDDLMLQGRDDMSTAMKLTKLPKYPGTARQTVPSMAALIMVQFSADAIKTRLWQMINGFGEFKWFVHDLTPHEYIWQMASEESTDGHWEPKKSNSQNHLWDCEVMQVVMARTFGMLEDYGITMEEM